MQIIGEKINGTRTLVKKAIADRDTAFVQDLAKRQAQAGANWLDVNAGTAPDHEAQDLVWLVQTVQEAVDAPLCLDSATPAALAAALQVVHKSPLINSISGEQKRIDGILPLVRGSGCGVIALAMDDKGIPAGPAERLDVIRRVIDRLHAAGIPDERIYVDPLVMTVASNPAGARIALDTMRAVHAEFPKSHRVSGLSNVSFGLPVRTLINQAFLTLALDAGLDTAILDPLDRGLKQTLLAAQVVLGQDRHCLGYTRAFRAGLLERER